MQHSKAHCTKWISDPTANQAKPQRPTMQRKALTKHPSIVSSNMPVSKDATWFILDFHTPFWHRCSCPLLQDPPILRARNKGRQLVFICLSMACLIGLHIGDEIFELPLHSVSPSHQPTTILHMVRICRCTKLLIAQSLCRNLATCHHSQSPCM